VGNGEVLGPLRRPVLLQEEGGARGGGVQLQAPLLQDLCDAPVDKPAVKNEDGADTSRNSESLMETASIFNF